MKSTESSKLLYLFTVTISPPVFWVPVSEVTVRVPSFMIHPFAGKVLLFAFIQSAPDFPSKSSFHPSFISLSVSVLSGLLFPGFLSCPFKKVPDINKKIRIAIEKVSFFIVL